MIRDGSVALFVAALICCGCGVGSKTDPRCIVDAESPHRERIARSINGSDLWSEYLDQVAKDGKRKVMRFTFTVERRVQRVGGGDYDPGTIFVDFKATSLKNGELLYKKDVKVRLDEFIVGVFDKNASRQQIQEIAFRATEKKVYPYLDRWIQIAAINAMGNEDVVGGRFKDTLERLIEDKWTSTDMRSAARRALERIEHST
jgi:hypothetical protein